MSMDYKKKTYRPSRPDTRNVTSYGSMSKWISRQNETPFPLQPRGEVPRHLIDRANPSPQFTKKRPRMRQSPAGHPTMYDSWFNNTSAVMPRTAPLDHSAPLDQSVPIHLRYSNHCGYDDYHKAFRSIEDKHPDLTYPHYGPPRLRHGRQGGSWRHVKEVLQAGGHRIVFVDGQISSDDIIKMDNVPGGHLILPEYNRGTPSPRLVQQMNRLPGLHDNSVAISRSPRLQQIPVARYSELDAIRGMEKDNWHVMR